MRTVAPVGPLKAAVLLAAACVALGIAAYGPAIFGDYGRSDDYGLLASHVTGNDDYSRQFITDGGRPVTAVVMTTLVSQVETVEGLWLLRLASTVALALGAATAALMVLRISRGPHGVTALVLAACTGGVVLSTTSAPSAATWAVIAGGMLAFPAAMGAGLWATTARRHWWVVSAGLLLVAVFSYQQVAPIAVLPTMLWSAHRWARREQARWSRTLVVGLLTVAALGANVWFVRQRSSVAMSRISDATLSERWQWFTHELLPRTVDLQVLHTTESLVWSSLLLVALLLFPALTGPRFLAGSAAVVLAWVGASLTVLPLELWASFRLASPAQFVLWGGAAAVFSSAVLRISRPRLRVALVVASIAATAGSLAVAGTRAEKYFAEPNERDWTAIRCAVEEEGGVTADTRVQLSHFDVGQSAVIAMDEYGIIASSIGWAVQPAAWLAASEMPGADPEVQHYEIPLVPPDEEVPGALRIAYGESC